MVEYDDMKAAIKIVAVSAIAGMLAGCKSGVLAPRSGELFQTTRMGPGKVTKACCGLTLGGLFIASEGRPAGYLVAIAGLPLAIPALIVDECVVSPLTDIVCLPYDLCQPNHGFYKVERKTQSSDERNMLMDARKTIARGVAGRFSDGKEER